MAELATIARPYAEALFKAAAPGDLQRLSTEVQAIADVAGDPTLRRFADDPKIEPRQVFELVTSVVKAPLSDPAKNLLHAAIDNGRLAAFGAIASHFQTLVNARSGVSDATVYSAFKISPTQLAEVTVSLEKRFARKLNPTVILEPSLIGGIRVVVGDEVLDTSVKARLEQMRVALTA